MQLPIGYPRRDSRGRARKRYLGKIYDFGVHGTLDSIKEYERFLAETLSRTDDGRRVQRGTMTISIMIAAWLEFAADETGREHPETLKTLRALMPLERLYGHTHADDFRLPRLREVRNAMVTGSWMTPEEKAATRKNRPTDWSASYTAKQMNRVLHVFQWAEGRDLLPEGRMHHLRELEPLSRNSKKVRREKPRTAVDVETQVNPTLPYLNPVYACAVQLQLLTAARPGEIMQIRRDEIDKNGPKGCWVYTPEKWKNAWRGEEFVRSVLLGPEAQGLIRPYLVRCPADDSPLFRSKRRGENSFSSEGLAKAVKQACTDANVKPWTPGQLRHTARLIITRKFSLEHARAVLGHVSVSMTAQYSKGQDIELAAEVASKAG